MKTFDVYKICFKAQTGEYVYNKEYIGTLEDCKSEKDAREKAKKIYVNPSKGLFKSNIFVIKRDMFNKRKDNIFSMSFEYKIGLGATCSVGGVCSCNVETGEIEEEEGKDGILKIINKIYSQSKKMRLRTATIYMHDLKYYSIPFIELSFENDWNKNDIMGANSNMYGIDIKISKDFTIKLRDSKKKIPLKAKEIPDAYGLNMKVEDYKQEAICVACVISELYSNGMSKMTLSSDAFAYFKRNFGEFVYNKYFAPLTIEEDLFIRNSYKGGWCYCDKKGKNGKGKTLDVNSLFAYCMYTTEENKHPLPIGEPEYFLGKPEKNNKLFVSHFVACFELKENKLPTVKDTRTGPFDETKFIESSNFRNLELYMTSVELELFFEQYDVQYIEYIDGYYFNKCVNVFNWYIDKFMSDKIEATKEGNKSKRTIAKQYLVSLYGRFGMNKIRTSKSSILNESGEVEFKDSGINVVDAYRVDMASFITSYAMAYIVRMSQKFKDLGQFIYSDTDSIHFNGEIPEDIEIDDVKLGAFKVEEEFDESVYIKQKIYVHKKGEKYEIKCAGMSEDLKHQLEKRNDVLELFEKGFSTNNISGITGNIKNIITKGGVIKKDVAYKVEG